MGKQEIDDKSKELGDLLDAEMGSRYGEAVDEFHAMMARMIPEVRALRDRFADAKVLADKAIAVAGWQRDLGAAGGEKLRTADGPHNRARICEGAVKNLSAILNNLAL